MSHIDAVVAPQGRLILARCVADDGWPLRRTTKRCWLCVAMAAQGLIFLGKPSGKSNCRTTRILIIIDRKTLPSRQSTRSTRRG